MRQDKIISPETLGATVSKALALLFVMVGVIVLCAAPALIQHGASGIGALAFLAALLVVFAVVTYDQLLRSGVIAERQRRRMFRDVCRRVGLTAKAENGRLVLYPALSNVLGSASAWTARIKPLTGQTVGQWEKSADAFSLALAASVRFSDNGDSTITMKVGHAPLEASDAKVSTTDYSADEQHEWRKWLRNIPTAITEGGQRFALPAIDTHLLIVGESGAGKGSVIWSLLVGLVPAIRAGVVRVWGLDPKRVELAIGRGFFYRYAATPDDMHQMLKDAVADMESRSDQMAGVSRKFTPSREHPMNVIVIDELAYLSSMVPDTKTAKEINKLLQTLLVLGRSGGYMVVGAAQDPRKETIALRDLFPTRVGLRMKSGMVDLVLGSGARADGAFCDQIPEPSQGGAGQAFVIGEGSHDPKRVRFTWVSDELIQELSSQLQQQSTDDDSAA